MVPKSSHGAGYVPRRVYWTGRSCLIGYPQGVIVVVGERSSGVLVYSSPTYCWCGLGDVLGCIPGIGIGLQFTALGWSRILLFSGRQQFSRRYRVVKNSSLFWLCAGIKLDDSLYRRRYFKLLASCPAGLILFTVHYR